MASARTHRTEIILSDWLDIISASLFSLWIAATYPFVINCFTRSNQDHPEQRWFEANRSQERRSQERRSQERRSQERRSQEERSGENRFQEDISPYAGLTTYLTKVGSPAEDGRGYICRYDSSRYDSSSFYLEQERLSIFGSVIEISSESGDSSLGGAMSLGTFENSRASFRTFDERVTAGEGDMVPGGTSWPEDVKEAIDTYGNLGAEAGFLGSNLEMIDLQRDDKAMIPACQEIIVPKILSVARSTTTSIDKGGRTRHFHGKKLLTAEASCDESHGQGKRRSRFRGVRKLFHRLVHRRKERNDQ